MEKELNLEVNRALSFKELRISSPAFDENDNIPAKYTCDGVNVNPPLDIGNIPVAAKSLTIIVTGTYDEKEEWAHWLAWNIPPVKHIEESRHMEIEGLNYFGRKKYDGPCPTGGLHKYEIKVYALDDFLHLHSYATQQDVEKAMVDHILGFGIITFYYQRHSVRSDI